MSDIYTIISWFRTLFTSLFGFFYDLTDDFKIFVFLIPSIVILLLILIFDYIMPLFFGSPDFRLDGKFADLKLNGTEIGTSKPLQNLNVIRLKTKLNKSDLRKVNINGDLSAVIKDFEISVNRKAFPSEVAKIEKKVNSVIKNKVKSQDEIKVNAESNKNTVNNDEKIIKFPGKRESA